MPPRSTNAPKSAMFFTMPRRTWPSAISVRSCRFIMSRCSSMSLRREMTMFIRLSSILMIVPSISCPMNSEMSAWRRIETCEAGRNAGTPMSTTSPPLILRTTLPLTVSPSLWVETTRSQPRRRSALRLLRMIEPVSSSTLSRSTSTSSPMSISSGFSNSHLEMTPSDL